MPGVAESEEIIGLCRASSYAERAFVSPVVVGDLVEVARHNQSASRNASRASGGRYRPGLTLAGVVRARALSLISMSAWM